MQKKLCGMCKQEKQIEHFSPDTSTNSGYRWACKECEKIRRKESYERNRKARIKSTERWRAKPGNMKRHLDYQKVYRKDIKQKIFGIYGNACQCCGEKHQEFLTVDHIGGGGRQHRANGGTLGAYRKMLKNIDHDKYRVLCMNCNWAIRRGDECPHQAHAAHAAVEGK